jgi:hypothetical protein
MVLALNRESENCAAGQAPLGIGARPVASNSATSEPQGHCNFLLVTVPMPILPVIA